MNQQLLIQTTALVLVLLFPSLSGWVLPIATRTTFQARSLVSQSPVAALCLVSDDEVSEAVSTNSPESSAPVENEADDDSELALEDDKVPSSTDGEESAAPTDVEASVSDDDDATIAMKEDDEDDEKEEIVDLPEEPTSSSSDETPAVEDETSLLLSLQSLAAITSRGETATPEQLDQARSLVAQLEATGTKPSTTAVLQGTWELVFTDNKQLFRSSPFFMAGRAVCKTPEQADQYNWFCTMHRKALAISNIGPVKQIITPTQLISEFNVEAGAVPFLNDFTPFSYSGGIPLTIQGAIVSTADLTSVNETSFELLMDTVQIKGSNLPVLRPLLDNGLQLQSRFLGDFLENTVSDYSNPRPVVRSTFLTDRYRISRDMDDNIFVYVKTSDSVEPTDWSSVDADLGVARLLEGFNDAVTRFYL